MNETRGSAPLTADEMIRLATFLAERGHGALAFELVSTAVWQALTGVSQP